MKQFRADQSPILSLILPDNVEDRIVKVQLYKDGLPYQNFEINGGVKGYYSKKIGALQKGTYLAVYSVYKPNGRKDGKYSNAEETILISAIIDNDKIYNDVMGNIDYGESRTI